jgi:mRNA-degrading endonuclease toxin of MazEF toxin-antitoxin module
VVILTRNRAIPVLANVTVAAITGTIRGLPTEVPLGREHGLARECVANCDNLFTRSLCDRRHRASAAAHVVHDDQHAARDLIAERELALKAAGGRALLAFLRRRAFSARCRWSHDRLGDLLRHGLRELLA